MRPIHTALIALLPPIAAAQSTTYTLPGPLPQSRHGAAVAAVGDIDRDGCEDFAVGAPDFSTHYGKVTVHSGRDRSVMWTKVGTQATDRLGAALAGVGDVDGDGRPDVLVGAPGAMVLGDPRGRAFVCSGADGSVLLSLSGTASGEDFGAAVTSAGDVNGDGVHELLVGDPLEDVPLIDGTAIDDAGAVYLFSGASGALLVNRRGVWHQGHFGAAICGALDLDGNGALEFLVGAPDHGTGRAGRLELFAASGGASICIVGGGDSIRLGASLCALADATGDGLMDVAVGAPGFPAGGPDAGAVYVIRMTNLVPETLVPGEQGSRAGTSVASAGDVDGDGLTDFWIGAPTALPLLGGRGSVTLRSLASEEPLAFLIGATAGAALGSSVAAPDSNGDGALDLVAGQPGHDANGVDSGSALVALMADAAGVPYCLGSSACPCGASGPALSAGCPNSTGGAGKLVATGSARISQDTVVLRGSSMPNSTCLYFQGTTQVNGGAGAPFGDGLRCAGGTVTRLGTRTNAGGASSFPPMGIAGLAERGGAQPGQTLHYQVWYRDTASFCTSAMHNFTNAYSIAWLP